jgi:hypothetical protein
LELLILVECILPEGVKEEDTLKLFGVVMPNNLKSVNILMCYYKDLEVPLKFKIQHIVGFFLMEKSVFMMVFDDGTVWRVMNDKNKGIMDEYELKLNFKVVIHVMFDFNS